MLPECKLISVSFRDFKFWFTPYLTQKWQILQSLKVVAVYFQILQYLKSVKLRDRGSTYEHRWDLTLPSSIFDAKTMTQMKDTNFSSSTRKIMLFRTSKSFLKIQEVSFAKFLFIAQLLILIYLLCCSLCVCPSHHVVITEECFLFIFESTTGLAFIKGRHNVNNGTGPSTAEVFASTASLKSKGLHHD